MNELAISAEYWFRLALKTSLFWVFSCRLSFLTGRGGSTGTSAEIVDGEFVISDSQIGLSPGDYKVEIKSTQSTGKMIPGPGPNGQVEEMKQIIPARYNMQTELTATVKSDGENRFVFSLSK